MNRDKGNASGSGLGFGSGFGVRDEDGIAYHIFDSKRLKSAGPCVACGWARQQGWGAGVKRTKHLLGHQVLRQKKKKNETG